MKRTNRLIGIIAFAAVIGLLITACGNGSTDELTVAKIFRFTGINWGDYMGSGSFSTSDTITIGSTKITTTTAEFSFTDVYTKKGGTFNRVEGDTSTEYVVTWAYLYGSRGSFKGKIGIVYTSVYDKYAFLGYEVCNDTLLADYDFPSGKVYLDGMQNDVNGMGWK